jgi:hypothetical protein
LDNPDDLVRHEISRALQRPDVHVIPVLVDGARMPAEHELPPDLAPLSRRQSCELTDSRWEYDVESLTRRLRELLGEKPPGRSWKGWPVRTGLVIVALLIAVIALRLALESPGPEAPLTKAAALLNPTLDRNISFGQYLDRKEISRASY